jgi:hypothetical protein
VQLRADSQRPPVNGLRAAWASADPPCLDTRGGHDPAHPVQQPKGLARRRPLAAAAAKLALAAAAPPLAAAAAALPRGSGSRRRRRQRPRDGHKQLLLQRGAKAAAAAAQDAGSQPANERTRRCGRPHSTTHRRMSARQATPQCLMRACMCGIARFTAAAPPRGVVREAARLGGPCGREAKPASGGARRGGDVGGAQQRGQHDTRDLRWDEREASPAISGLSSVLQ